MKRFYSQAAIVKGDGGFTITLDGKNVRTPVGQILLVPSASLAEAIAGEWQAQGETIRPHDMPLTQLASTALDRVIPNRPAIVDQLVAYAGTDLLCYRAEGPQDLVERQESLWQPLIDWASAIFHIELRVTCGVIPVAQPATTLARLTDVVERYDPLQITALQSAVAAMGSLLLGLALVEGRLSYEEAFAASTLDETYQIELWGADDEALRAREALRKDIASARHFLELSVDKDAHFNN